MPKVDIKILEYMGKNNIRTIQELHEITGLSRTTLSRLINGKNTSITVDTLIKLCKTFECEIGELIVIDKEKISS
ncbi:helix-turn-helix domain-containing protein [Priestia megaterium]|jgi:putative transcriptional regulator|uniref:helix-turn-helix domain-containing protein n=1 Tax=Priestia megaterium TaxID=1404 RepID=UPI001363D2D6|nr:helix-turn-helix transcriptional regulator [Priestia megaterium]